MTRGSLSRERWRVVEPLLDAALELEPERREAFLDGACGRDGALRAEVTALLRACDRGDTILRTPAAVAYAPLLAEPRSGLPEELGGRYRLVQEIGRGGMATVYVARDTKHARHVAVKVLHADVAQLIGRDRFLREIEIVAGMSHPHILPLHDSGEVKVAGSDEPSLLYSVSPFVAGESLRARLQREPRLTMEEVARLGREVALALDYAHRQDVIHLDIKPGNILLHEGHAVVADFGIARAISYSNEDASSGAKSILGTPAYMSPEQALGTADVDGRSDVYSLGCVLYEMLAGSPPFGEETPEGALSRARALPVPDPAPLRARVSPALASVVLRAMAPARDERFATAGALATALSDATRVAAPRLARRSRRVLGGTLAAVALASLAAVWVAREPMTLDADLVAVAPFDVEAADLAMWKEGLVDVLSRNLDGAGPLRTVPATIVVRQWAGRADAPSARALGRRTGARLVLYGGVLSAGDSVRATAVLLDVATGRAVAEIERRDVPDRVDRLSDSLTVAVLRELGRSRRIDVARATSSPTTSLAALKAYLQGEQFYRNAVWDSAQLHFEHAVGLDSTFALAYHRLAAVRRWSDPKDIPDSATYALMQLTSHYQRGLAPRERLLAKVDSLSAEAHFAWRRAIQYISPFDDERVVVNTLVATLQEGLRQYPNDPELWFALAESRSRYDGDILQGEFDDRAVLALYDRAIALDSSLAPAYVVPISLSAYLDGAASARRYIRAYLGVAPSGPRSDYFRLADALLDPATTSSVDLDQIVETLSADDLCQVATLLRHITDSAEAIGHLARALTTHHVDRGPGTEGIACAFRQAVEGLQFRGHLRDAYRVTAQQGHWLRPIVMYNLARLHMVPADTARAEFAKILALRPSIRIPKLYGWWAEDGDTVPIATYVNDYTSDASQISAPRESRRLLDRAGIGRGFLALARRDTAGAVRLLLAASDSLEECRGDRRIAVAELLAATRRYREAAPQLERRWPGTSGCGNGFDDVWWTLLRARVFEKLGRDVDALVNYRFVANAWRTADPELQAYVSESRQAVERLEARR